MDIKYQIRVYWYQDDHEGYWVAQTSELPACPGVGETSQEAVANLMDVLRSVAEFSKELGIPMPVPNSSNTSYHSLTDRKKRQRRILHHNTSLRRYLHGDDG